MTASSQGYLQGFDYLLEILDYLRLFVVLLEQLLDLIGVKVTLRRDLLEAEVGPKEIERLHEVELVHRCLHNSHVLLEMQTPKAEIYFLNVSLSHGLPEGDYGVLVDRLDDLLDLRPGGDAGLEAVGAAGPVEQVLRHGSVVLLHLDGEDTTGLAEVVNGPERFEAGRERSGDKVVVTVRVAGELLRRVVGAGVGGVFRVELLLAEQVPSC